MPKLHKFSAVVRILILLALCGLSTAQILYVDDFCDFAGYDGICLEASKCTDLQAKMQALTLESHHVGRCGFGVREEIICCPKWPTPVQTPPKLPNAFIDLSKQPEFVYKPPLDGALSDSSIPITTSTPINFNQNGFFVANPVQNVHNNQNVNGNPVIDENERMNAIFGNNHEQNGNDNSQDEGKANFFPVVNENNKEFFIANPLLNVQDNQNINGNPVIDENERMNAIFGNNQEQNGNDNTQDESKANFFPVVNENNKEFFIANPLPNVEVNQNINGYPVVDENERINAIFGNSPEQIGNDNSQDEKENYFPLDNQNINGNPVIDENERMNAIFGNNHEQNGNDNSQDEGKANFFPVVNENNNGIFIANPLSNVQDNQLIGYPVIDENERINAIFGDNSAKNGNGNNKDEKKANSFPVVNENSKGFFISNPVLNVQDNHNLNNNPVIDENERLNDIFGGNREEADNDKDQEERKGNSVPVIKGNNGFFSATPVPNVQDNGKFIGSPVIDVNERIKAVFSENPIQIGSDNSKDERKGNSVPSLNGNNNGILNINPISNVQGNQKLNGNPVVDENEKFNALFNGTPLPIDDERVRPSGAINQDSAENLKAKINAIFGGNHEPIGNANDNEESKGNSVPVINGNTNGIFIQNVLPNIQDNQKINGNPVVDENERFNALFNGTPLPIDDERVGPSGVIDQDSAENLKAKINAIFGGNREEVSNDNANEKRKGNLVPVISGINNGIFNQNPKPNVQNNQKLDGNPVVDENERFNAIFNGTPLPIDDERVGKSGVIDQDSAENLKAKINAIFGGNREQIGNANDNEKSKGNSVPVINGNNNGIFIQNPIPNVQNNQKLEGNRFFDENERFNAIFNGNPIPKETHLGGLNGVISQNPAIFGGKSVQLEDTNNSEVLNRKPMPGDNELAQNNAAMDGQGIPDEKALINAILNGQLESSPGHFIFNDKPLRGRPANRRRLGTIMENRSTLNNGRFNMRNHRRFEETTHRRNQGVYRGPSRNTRIRFTNN